jgi:hypothetical protein
MANGRALSLDGVFAWTMAGNVARVYRSGGAWMLRTPDPSSLHRILTAAFGPPLALRRRGTARARYVALSVACAGALGSAAGFGAESVPLVLAGIPLLMFGAAFWGALSQKVADVTKNPANSPSEEFRHRAGE